MSILKIPYIPRRAFIEYHENKKRFSCSVCHRRAGKSVARLNQLIRKAVECDKLNPRFGYISPFFVQSKEIAWQYLKHYTQNLAPLGLRINESELSITFGHNNATIRLYGAENSERIRGLYFDGIVVDEAQGISGAVLRTIILPALSDRRGYLDVSGTPRGWNNLLGDIVKIAQDNPDEWYLHLLKASESGIIPESELNIQRKLMSDNEFAQEYEISFDAAITGAVYGKEMEAIRQAGRIRSGLYDPSLPVFTAWDLGWSDKTAIWFWQRLGMEVRLIDFYQASFEDAEHFANILRDKGYKYGEHYLPHDAAEKRQSAGGRSFIDQLMKFGLKHTRIVAATTQMNQIEALRWVMRNMWIDSKCEVGMQCLREYRYKWIEDIQDYGKEPRHDSNSHAADACEIIGQVLRKSVEPEKPSKPRFLHETTANEVFWPNTSHLKPSRERI